MELIIFGIVSLIIIDALYLTVPYFLKFGRSIIVNINGNMMPVKIKESDQINAFSLYNGDIIITSRSLELKEDEVRAIISHELGHVRLHHHLKMLIIMNILVFLLLNSVNYIIIFIPLAIFFVLFQRFLSRRFELEADSYAVKLVGKDALYKVIINYGEKKSNILSTHPSSLARTKNI